jgi:amidase
MAFQLPNPEQFKRLGAEMGMDITTEYAQSVINFVKPFADGYLMIAAQADELPAIRYLRGGLYRPEGEENKYGAWAVKTSIKGAETPARGLRSRTPTAWPACR